MLSEELVAKILTHVKLSSMVLLPTETGVSVLLVQGPATVEGNELKFVGYQMYCKDVSYERSIALEPGTKFTVIAHGETCDIVV